MSESSAYMNVGKKDFARSLDSGVTETLDPLGQRSGTFLAERAMEASYLTMASMRAIQLGIGVGWDHKIF